MADSDSRIEMRKKINAALRNFQPIREDKKPGKDREEDAVLLFYKGICGSCLTLQGATKEGGEEEGWKREREEKCRGRQRRWSEEIKGRGDHLKRLHPLHQHSGKLIFIFFAPSAGFQTPGSVRVNLPVKAVFFWRSDVSAPLFATLTKFSSNEGSPPLWRTGTKDDNKQICYSFNTSKKLL